jgi:RNA 2',3'-cyclic 3'-phosphodiesterase
MADKRTFIAIALPDAVKEQLSKVQTLLEPVSEGIRWVDPELMHITLKFLGDTPEWLLENIGTEIKRIVANIQAFQLQLSKLGQFPKEGEPRILWAGLQKNPPIVYKLSDEFNTAFFAMGFDDTGKRFSPHITLGKVKQKLNEELIASYHDISLEEDEFTVNKIIWYESLHRHGKLEYLPLEEFDLVSKSQ